LEGKLSEYRIQIREQEFVVAQKQNELSKKNQEIYELTKEKEALQRPCTSREVTIDSELGLLKVENECLKDQLVKISLEKKFEDYNTFDKSYQEERHEGRPRDLKGSSVGDVFQEHKPLNKGLDLIEEKVMNPPLRINQGLLNSDVITLSTLKSENKSESKNLVHKRPGRPGRYTLYLLLRIELKSSQLTFFIVIFTFCLFPLI
jgi:hypothetical protein